MCQLAGLQQLSRQPWMLERVLEAAEAVGPDPWQQPVGWPKPAGPHNMMVRLMKRACSMLCHMSAEMVGEGGVMLTCGNRCCNCCQTSTIILDPG